MSRCEKCGATTCRHCGKAECSLREPKCDKMRIEALEQKVVALEREQARAPKAIPCPHPVPYPVQPYPVQPYPVQPYQPVWIAGDTGIRSSLQVSDNSYKQHINAHYAGVLNALTGGTNE